MSSTPDIKYMNIALSIARRGVGTVAPNPAVGCVIVKNNQIIATAHTGKGGRPHAEQIALKNAGKNANGATVYVTLEPCCHTGKTPPCTDSLIKAGISRVVIATKDPFPQVAGKGIEQLQKAGISISYGVCEKPAKKVNAGFLTVQTQQRPFVTLKLATSLDGKISTSTGESKWITNEIARNYAHLLRAKNDAVMVGIETVLADNPELTCRLQGLENQSPLRIIMDSNLRTPKNCKLLKNTDTVPCWIITSDNISNNDIEKTGARIICCKKDDNYRIQLEDALESLAKHGITRLLVEGGSRLATSFIVNNLVDELIWIKAPIIIGNDGIPAVSNLNISNLKSSVNLSLKHSKMLGDNVVEILLAI